VSGQTAEEYKLNGLGLGADDYITKPFSANELVARIRSFLRRRDRMRAGAASARLPMGDAVLVRDTHTLERDGKAAVLTALEFRLLWFLADSEGKLLTRAQILDTRKTTPGWRRFEKYAVRCGGGRNHRQGLYDMILIKDNHLAALRGAAPNAVAAAVKRAREKYPALKVEVEADTLEQVEQAVAAGAD